MGVNLKCASCHDSFVSDWTLADAYGLRNLSAPLREVAELRLAHPTDTLAELGRRCVPEVKKSTVNGRITALLRIAKRLGQSSPQR